MLLARAPGGNKEDRAQILDMVRDRRLGGIHLHSRDPLIAEIREIADYPILIADNMEMGVDAEDALQLPSPIGVGATNDERCAHEFARLTAIDARNRGYSLAFGPVLDIAMNPAASCVGPRTFGGGVDLVTRMSVAAVRGYQEEGLVVTGKHYPGFGESAVDSHIGMVTLTCDESLLLKRELVPYAAAIREADMSGVMVGHIMVPAVDPELPASLSPRLIGLLRNIGFDGLVMTDSLAMVGLTNWFGLEECHSMSMSAGNDMIITSYRITAETAHGWMLKALHDGNVSEEQIDAAARRVAAAQARTIGPPQQQISDSDRASAIDLSARCITTELNGVESPALDPLKRHLFLVQTANQFVDPQTGEPQRDVDLARIDHMVESIRHRFAISDIHRINDFPSRAQMEKACKVSMGHDSVVAMMVARTDHYMGSSDLTKRMLALLDGLGEKLQAVVLAGNPYAARELPRVPRLIYAFDGTECHRAAVDVLAGALQPRGTLPVEF